MLEPFVCSSTSCNLSLLFCKKTDQKSQPTEAFSCHQVLYENTRMYYLSLINNNQTTSQKAQDVCDINQGKHLVSFYVLLTWKSTLASSVFTSSLDRGSFRAAACLHFSSTSLRDKELNTEQQTRVRTVKCTKNNGNKESRWLWVWGT